MSKNIRLQNSNLGAVKLQLFIVGRLKVSIRLNDKIIPFSKLHQIERNKFEVKLGNLVVNNILSINITGNEGYGLTYQIVDRHDNILFKSGFNKIGRSKNLIISEKFRLINSVGYNVPKQNLKISENLEKFNFKVIDLNRKKVSEIEKESVEPFQMLNEDNSTVTLYYGTNRNKISQSSEHVVYGNRRGGILTYGKCEVHIPVSKRMGELNRPAWFQIWGRHNPDKYVTILNTKELGPERFFSDIFSNSEFKSNDVLVFVHGYNTSFNESAMRAAQVAYDINFHGIPMFFSWSSKAHWLKYNADVADIEFAEKDIVSFLLNIRERIQPGRIFLVAHSLGNRGLTNAMIQLLESPFYKYKLVDQLIMAAPDIDSEHFVRSIAPKLVTCSAQLTIYASSKDLALKLSRFFKSDIERLGESGNSLVCVDKIDTVDASNVRTDLLGHGYFASTQSLINDIQRIIHSGLKPNDRNLNKHERNGKTYWSLKRV